jgi:hypothetical protein
MIDFHLGNGVRRMNSIPKDCTNSSDSFDSQHQEINEASVQSKCTVCGERRWERGQIILCLTTTWSFVFVK